MDEHSLPKIDSDEPVATSKSVGIEEVTSADQEILGAQHQSISSPVSLSKTDIQIDTSNSN